MNIYKFFVRSLIKKLSYSFNGDLTLIFPDKSEYRLGKNKSNYFLKIKSNHFFFRLLYYGVSSIGYSYYKGEWTTNNLSYVIKLGIENIKTIKNFKLRQKILENIIKMFSFSESNTVSKSKKQISYHYDLGDNFYKCWLDKTMTYSSAIFENKDISLERAQLNKYHSLVKLADIKKDNSILEIGCGWGGFTNYISKNIGSNITGITISKNQYNYVKKLLQTFL